MPSSTSLEARARTVSMSRGAEAEKLFRRSVRPRHKDLTKVSETPLPIRNLRQAARCGGERDAAERSKRAHVPLLWRGLFRSRRDAEAASHADDGSGVGLVHNVLTTGYCAAGRVGDLSPPAPSASRASPFELATPETRQRERRAAYAAKATRRPRPASARWARQCRSVRQTPRSPPTPRC